MIIRSLPSSFSLFALLLLLTSTTTSAFQSLLRPTTRHTRPTTTTTTPSYSSSSSSSLLRLYARSLIWFTSGDLRLHDNEALSSPTTTDIEKIPLFIFDPLFLSTLSPHTIQLYLSAINDLRSSFQKQGTDLLIRVGPVETHLPTLLQETQADSMYIYDDISDNQRELVKRGLASLPSSLAIKKWKTPLRAGITGATVGNNWEKDYKPAIRGKPVLPPLPSPSPSSSSLSSSLPLLPQDKGRLPSFEELLDLAYTHTHTHTPDVTAALKHARAHAAREEYWTPTYTPTSTQFDTHTHTHTQGGESLALAWLDDYLSLGSVPFGEKHLPSSGEGLERQVLRRLIAAKGYSGLFEGEIYTRTFTPLLGLGVLSPRYVLQKIEDMRAKEGVGVSGWLAGLVGGKEAEWGMVQECVERREWHEVLAEKDIDHTAAVEEPMEFKYWKFHGHNVRYAVSKDADPTKPALLLVHGFGASSDQWAKCFKELSADFRVFALDLLGFGHAEKPAITYTQYLWQDQVRDFALEVVQSPFFVAGNSIGGFTAMSVAADIGPLCKGLILINTAGKVVSPDTYTQELEGRGGQTVEDATRFNTLPPFSGPPKAVLKLFSAGLFAYLQPNVEKICKDLYKKNPNEVGQRLVTNIVRDSCDPGALGVFASGGRLPTPRPANELMSKFGGPVLVAQGILDPLNDAKGRAELLRQAWRDVEVVEIEGGHCVHDEDPARTSEAIRQFVWRVLKGGERGGGGEKEKTEGVAVVGAA